MRMPEQVIEKIRGLAGTMSDAEVASVVSELTGHPLHRHTVMTVRKRFGIDPHIQKTYTKPRFHGPVESEYPDVLYLIGKVSVQKISEYYQVSRCAIAQAAARHGLSTRVRYVEPTVESLLWEKTNAQAGSK